MLTGSFSESIKRRCSVLQWNPDVATQLVVASDEDSSPALRVMGSLLQSLFFFSRIALQTMWMYNDVCTQLWDMRNTMSPVKEFVGHTKGMALHNMILYCIFIDVLPIYVYSRDVTPMYFRLMVNFWLAW